MFVGLLFCAARFVWYAAYLLGRRAEAQPLIRLRRPARTADYGRTLADGAF